METDNAKKIVKDLKIISNNLLGIAGKLEEDPNRCDFEAFCDMIMNEVEKLERIKFLMQMAKYRKHRQAVISSGDMRTIVKLWDILNSEGKVSVISAMDDSQFDEFMKAADEEGIWETR